MGIRSKIGRVVKRAVVRLYWRIGANEEDDPARNALIYDYIPPEANMDTVVAQIDKAAAIQGGQAVKILRRRSNDAEK